MTVITPKSLKLADSPLSDHPRPALATVPDLAYRLALGAILLLSALLHFLWLGQEGYANLYYAAAVKSMLAGWHNFFFVSFDPGGFVTVDKPPLGLWIQAAGAWLFGFSGWSILLSQALAGVLSVWLLYYLVACVFGRMAGLLAALTLTLTPIFVAANRNNTMDSLLLFTLLVAAWAISRATETGRLRWLLAGAFLVGAGFNIKMMQAFLALPAFFLLYLLAAPISRWKRIFHLTLATMVLGIVSLAWPLIVDLTPPEQRPFIGSSKNNSVLELIVGHNGFSRLLPGGWPAIAGRPGPGGPPPPVNPGRPPAGGQGAAPLAPQQGIQPLPPAGGQPAQPANGAPPPGGPRGGGGPGGNETGQKSLLRLFNRQLAGQISWFLPLAALGLVAAWSRPLTPGVSLRRHRQVLLLWALWLLPQFIFFSVANMFHRYYLEMLAPAIAALVGAGLVAMIYDYRRAHWRGWLLPVALLCSAALQLHILFQFPEWGFWLAPLAGGLTVLSALGLIVLRVPALRVPALRARSSALQYATRNTKYATRNTHHASRNWPVKLLIATSLLALLIAPTIWTVIPVWHGGDVGLPFAGPELLERPHRSGELRVNDKLVNYLLEQRRGEEFLAATDNSHMAAPIILTTGQPVMAMGGFNGGDHILSAGDLPRLAAGNTVRFFLLPARGAGGPPLPRGGGQSEVAQWVESNCVAVPAHLWQDAALTPQTPPPPGRNEAVQLFDCAG